MFERWREHPSDFFFVAVLVPARTLKVWVSHRARIYDRHCARVATDISSGNLRSNCIPVIVHLFAGGREGVVIFTWAEVFLAKQDSAKQDFPSLCFTLNLFGQLFRALWIRYGKRVWANFVCLGYLKIKARVGVKSNNSKPLLLTFLWKILIAISLVLLVASARGRHVGEYLVKSNLPTNFLWMASKKSQIQL